MRFASTTTLAEIFTSSGRLCVGKGSTESAASARNQFRWWIAPSTTHKEGPQEIEMTKLSTTTATQLTAFAILGAITRKGHVSFSLLFLAALILSFASSAFAQVGGAISGQYVTPTGQPAANARITVCPYTANGIPCFPQAAIYSDPALTVHLTQPYAANNYGNFTVFVNPGTYIVQVAVNPTTTYSYTWTVNANGLSNASGAGAPALACSSVNVGQIYTDLITGNLYTCNGTVWIIGGGGAFLPLVGGTITGSLNGTNAAFSGPVTAPFSQSVSCTNGNNSADYTAVQGAINYIEANAPNGRGTLRIPEGAHCNILPPSNTATEALLVTGPVSGEGHGVFSFQMPAPTTASVTACSISTVGVVSTATITASNTFVAGWSGFITGFSGGCSVLNDDMFTILPSGLSGSQFKFIVPKYIPSPITATDSATATATMSRLRMAPGVGKNMNNVSWKDILFRDVSSPDVEIESGGNIIDLDCSSAGLAYLQFENLTFGYTAAGGFHSIFMDNGYAANANGCVSQSNFKAIGARGGAYFQHIGDNNKFTGAGIYVNRYGDGFNAESIQGSVSNTVSGGTFEGKTHSLRLRGGVGWLISDIESLGNEINAQTGASVYLDGSDIYYNPLNGTVIENSNLGVDVIRYPYNAPNFQDDASVTTTTIRDIKYNPQIVSGVPVPAILHNGGILKIDGAQTYLPIKNYSLYAGAGSYGKNTPITAEGGGDPIENDGIWSENPNFWSKSAVGSGSSVVVASTPTAVMLPNGQPGFAYAVTLTLGSNAGGYSASLFYTSHVTLPNPHGIVRKVYILPTGCPTPQLFTLSFGSQPQDVNCSGTYNGWSLLKFSAGNTASTSDAISVYLAGGIGNSTTISFYAIDAQLSQNDGDYVQTTNQAVPLSYGNDPAHFASADPYPVTSTTGFQDTSTAARGACGLLNVGTTYIEKGTGTLGSDIVLQCNVTNSTTGTYAWITVYQLPLLTENSLLQSNTGTVSPWASTATGTALAPVVTSAPVVADPFTNTGTVQEVVLDLNGDVTPGHYSLWLQARGGLTNPHTATVSGWFKAKTGSPIILWGNNTSGYGTITLSSTTWTYFTRTDVNATTADYWFTELIAGSGTSTSADFYVFGLGITYNGGAAVSPAGVPTITTTAAIDNTANAPILCNPTTGSAGQFCDPTQAWVTPAGGAGLTTNIYTGTQTAPAFNLQSKAAGPYSQFFDDFYTAVNSAAVAIGSASGQSCASQSTYSDVNHPGNLRLASGTAGTGTGEECISSTGAAQLVTLNTSLPWTWEAPVIVPVLPGTTAGSYQYGTAGTPGASPWTTGMGFGVCSTALCPSGATQNNWFCEYASTYIDSTVAATTGWTRLTMVQDGTKLHYYANGAEVCGTGIAIASLPSTNQFVFAFTDVAGSATSVLTAVDYVNFQRAVVR